MVPYKPLYWRIMSPLIRHSVKRRWGKDVADKALDNGAKLYSDLLLCAPDLGEDNPMLPTFCQSMAFVAVWLGADGAIPIDGMRYVTKDVLGFKPLKVVGLVRNANRGDHALDFQLDAMRKSEQWACENEGSYESAWRVRFDDERHQDGIFFEYTRCPIAEYCADLGLGKFTPVLCNIDHQMVELIHARLLREHTIADGAPICDYWIVGDKTSNPS